MSSWSTTTHRKTHMLIFDTSRPSTQPITAKKGSPTDVSLLSARSHRWSFISPAGGDLPGHKAKGSEGEEKRRAFSFLYKKGKPTGYRGQSHLRTAQVNLYWKRRRRGRRESWLGAGKENEVWSSLFHLIIIIRSIIWKQIHHIKWKYRCDFVLLCARLVVQNWQQGNPWLHAQEQRWRWMNP